MHAMRTRIDRIATTACLAWLAWFGAIIASGPAAAAAPQSPLDNARQLLLVVTPDWTAVDGTMRRFERPVPGAAWKPNGPPVPVVVGRSGMAWGRGLQGDQPSGPIKKEGDGKSPAGVFRLGPAFGISPDKPADWRVPYRFLDHDVECVDDSQSRHYNQLVTRAGVDLADWASSEKMWAEPLYEWGLVVEHNAAPVGPGAGSCIFLHIWIGPGRGTAGCTAMDVMALTDTLGWLDPAGHPRLVQLPAREYDRLKAAWQLP